MMVSQNKLRYHSLHPKQGMREPTESPSLHVAVSQPGSRKPRNVLGLVAVGTDAALQLFRAQEKERAADANSHAVGQK